MRSLRPFLAPLLVALSATAPTLARADADQPAPPAANPDGPTRPWIDETDATRPSGNEGKPARPTGESAAAPSGAQEAPPARDEGRRPAAEGRGSVRSTNEAKGRARATAGSSDAIGFSTADGEHLGTSAAAAAAARQAKARFGHQGHFIVDNVIGFRTGGGFGALGGVGMGGLGGVQFTGLLSVVSDSTKLDEYDTKFTSVGVRPSVDYFLANGLSVGGSLTFAYLRSTYESASSGPGRPPPIEVSHQQAYQVGLEPRLGVALPLTEALSLWPRLGAGYHANATGSGGAIRRIDTFSAFTRLGLVVNAGRHLFFDVGPELRITHSASDPQAPPEYKSTTVGAGVNGGLGLAF
ncbi:MAG: hypothetical protein MUF34_25045 [Polyangiaceae bacterium]|jgi:hypothetical protein|nr:hypothetical protein [Polyangiaceae bacterium]